MNGSYLLEFEKIGAAAAREDVFSMQMISVHDAYIEAQERADQNGYILSGPHLFKKAR